MDWKFKAAIQSAISILPEKTSYEIYYQIQRRFGNLRVVEPLHWFKESVEIWQRAKSVNYEPRNKVIFEIGTGRMPMIAVGYWLMGAAKTITIDINRYVRSDLLDDVGMFVRENTPQIQGLFGSLLDRERLGQLVHLFQQKHYSLESLMNLCCVQYHAPYDACYTELEAASIDMVTSNEVLGQVRYDLLPKIFEEASRILRRDGISIHRIDYSDPFFYADSRISRINFLKFSDKSWEKIASNRYAYANRLRHDDFIRMFESAGHAVLLSEPKTDPDSTELLARNGLRINQKFADKSTDVLRTIEAFIVTSKKPICA